MPSQVDVIIAIKHPLIALGVRSALTFRNDIRIAEQCSTMPATARALKRYRPTVLIAEASVCNGPGTLEMLARSSPATRIALLCVSAGEFSDEMLFAGAGAVLPPDTDPRQLRECVHALAAGRRWRAPLRVHSGAGRVPHPAPGGALPRLSVLSARERQVAEGVASGKRNREIAEALGITPGTVKLHVSRIFEKLRVNSRLALLRKMLSDKEADTREPGT